jgi:hypothetical protein
MQFKLQHADSQIDDPHDVIVAQLRDLAPRLAHDPSELNVMPPASPEPASEPPLRTMPLNDNTGDIRNPEVRARSHRGVVLLIVCTGIAAAAAWHSYGDEAKQRLSSLLPPFLAGAPALTQNATAPEPQDAASQIAAPQPVADATPAQTAAAPVTPSEPVTAASTPAMETPSTQSAVPAELAQSIETMTREIASLKQTVEQLQAGQQQLGRDGAKITEQEARRKLAVQTPKPAQPPRQQRALTPGAPPRTLGTLAPYSPPPATSQGQTYPQGAAQREAYVPPSAPAQLPPQPGDTSVPRPPMPLR